MESHDPKQTISSAKHGGGSVMAWARMVSNGAGSLVFINDATEDGCARMNSELYSDVSSAQIPPDSVKLIGLEDSNTDCESNPDVFKAKKWNILRWPSRSPDLNPIERAFHLPRTKPKAERPADIRHLKTAAVNAWPSVTNEETQRPAMSVGSRLRAVIACKGFSTEY